MGSSSNSDVFFSQLLRPLGWTSPVWSSYRVQCLGCYLLLLLISSHTAHAAAEVEVGQDVSSTYNLLRVQQLGHAVPSCLTTGMMLPLGSYQAPL